MKLTAASLRRKRRVAISEVFGSLLSIAVTVIAGAAVFGYVNNQARVSEVNYANSVANTNNYLAESFKVIDIYFPSSTQIAFWVYNSGNTNLQTFQVRVYGTAGLINILYNYTVSGSTKTDRLYDLRATSAYYFSTCRLSGSSYENPTVSSVNTVISNSILIQLTVPPTTTNCPSYGSTFNTGTTYYVVVTGVYGNVVSYYQTK